MSPPQILFSGSPSDADISNAALSIFFFCRFASRGHTGRAWRLFPASESTWWTTSEHHDQFSIYHLLSYILIYLFILFISIFDRLSILH